MRFAKSEGFKMVFYTVSNHGLDLEGQGMGL